MGREREMRPILTRAHAPSSLLRARRPTLGRGLAFQAAGPPIVDVFHRHTKWLQKKSATANAEASRQADYLRDEVATRLCERPFV